MVEYLLKCLLVLLFSDTSMGNIYSLRKCMNENVLLLLFVHLYIPDYGHEFWCFVDVFMAVPSCRIKTEHLYVSLGLFTYLI